MMVNIHKITEKDLSQFVKLWNQQYLVLTSSQFKMTLDRAIDGFKSKMFIYGLYTNNELKGFVLLKQGWKYIWLKHLLVDKKIHHQGYGTSMVHYVRTIAKRKNKIVRLEITRENKGVIEFFVRNKFKIIKYERAKKQYILQDIKPKLNADWE